MSLPAQYLAVYLLLLPLPFLLKPYVLRKWLGIMMIASGLCGST